MIDVGLPHSERHIREAIEKEKSDKRAGGERVTGMACISFSQASMAANEYERYGKNIPAAAPRTRIKRAKAKGQQDESLAPNPAKSARVETALPGLTTALAKAGELQRRQQAEAPRESEVRTVLRSASRQRRCGVSDPHLLLHQGKGLGKVHGNLGENPNGSDSNGGIPATIRTWHFIWRLEQEVAA